MEEGIEAKPAPHSDESPTDIAGPELAGQIL